MKAVAFVFIALTALDGSPIWVDATPGVVSIIRQSKSECKHGTGAAISVGGRGLCVKETPDEIRQKIREAK